jgi:hypothetical protein
MQQRRLDRELLVGVEKADVHVVRSLLAERANPRAVFASTSPLVEALTLVVTAARQPTHHHSCKRIKIARREERGEIAQLLLAACASITEGPLLPRVLGKVVASGKPDRVVPVAGLLRLLFTHGWCPESADWRALWTLHHHWRSSASEATIATLIEFGLPTPELRRTRWWRYVSGATQFVASARQCAKRQDERRETLIALIVDRRRLLPRVLATLVLDYEIGLALPADLTWNDVASGRRRPDCARPSPSIDRSQRSID